MESAADFGDTIHNMMYGTPVKKELEQSEAEFHREVSARESIAQMENALANLKKVQLEKLG